MIVSMCTVLSNKVKQCFMWPKKNRDLAKNKDVKNLVFVILEQILPQWCGRNCHDIKAIDLMHNLMCLLAQKVHGVFFTRVIHTIIDQNWDLKGFKQVLIRIMTILQIGSNQQTETFSQFIDQIIDLQNQ